MDLVAIWLLASIATAALVVGFMRVGALGDLSPDQAMRLGDPRQADAMKTPSHFTADS